MTNSMMHLDYFCEFWSPTWVTAEKIAQFKLFWIHQNQISPHKYPITQPNRSAWVELFDLWDEGLLPHQIGV